MLTLSRLGPLPLTFRDKMRLESVWENPPFGDLVPEGRLRVAQDVVLGTMHKATKSPARDG
jgi:hypothetical protein